MFHAPTTESKQSDRTRSQLPPERTRELSPLVPAAMGPASAGALAGAPALGRADSRHPLARLHSAYGNQAVLRTLSRAPWVIQTKLTVNKPGDPFEQEADRIADQVVRMPDPSSIQRKSSLSAGEEKLRRKCTECEEEEKKTELRRKETNPGPQFAPPSVHQVLNSPGRTLDRATRAFMEPRFGVDFSGVRIHDGLQAAESASAIAALAYTVGQDIVFGASQYSPGSNSGQRLLAHELAHVVQQSHVAPRTAMREPEKPAEPPPQPAPAPAPAAKQAQSGTDSKGQDYVVYGNEIRVGGTRTWRNNNPGNFDKPEDHPKNIGDDGNTQAAKDSKRKFLIFPDAATGMKELIDSIEAHGKAHAGSTIRSFITVHAPPKENPTETYITHVLGYMNNGFAIGGCEIKKPARLVNEGTALTDLNASERSSLAVAMAREEGWCDVFVKKASYNCQSTSIPDEYKGKLICP